MTSQPTSIGVSTVAGTTETVLHIPERLSVLEAVDFKDTCKMLCESESLPVQITLDFSRTAFVDSSGIGALVSSYKLAHATGVSFVLRDVQPPVMAVLSMTGLDAMLPIERATAPMSTKAASEEVLPPATHPSVRSWVKRTLDIAGSLVGLTILGVLFVPLAIAIRLDSPGPILFSQSRCGWMGKRFRLWKFRSMVSDAEARRKEVKNQAEGAFFKNDNDPRITRIGRFLRRTSLDELPQFWNVLRGDMSLVGTRPPTPDEVERYEVPQWQRLDVRPGMTGEWQVNGRSTVKKFEDVIRLDLKYQENWSLKHDLKLILKTVALLFSRSSGAM
ncbi:MAG: STAS domain-containing protein [Limnothrix sp. CACIAM 69d]|nr:MAG: STAS domain-containing protein [Limnothrix sp. CACIAM 69d]